MLTMTPDRLAQLLAIHYARIEAMTFAEGESLDLWTTLVADYLREDPRRMGKLLPSIMLDLCGHGHDLDEDAIDVFQSAWTLHRLRRKAEEQHDAKIEDAKLLLKIPGVPQMLAERVH